jgi:hypothetical protein
MVNDLGVVFKVYLISLGLQFLVWPVNTDVGVGVVILVLLLVGLRSLQSRFAPGSTPEQSRLKSRTVSDEKSLIGSTKGKV